MEAGGIEPPSETRLERASTSVSPTTFLASRPRRSWVRPASHPMSRWTPVARVRGKPTYLMPPHSPADEEGATGA